MWYIIKVEHPYAKLKEGMRWMWSLGDYSRLAEVLEPHAEALADACEILPGIRARRGRRELDESTSVRVTVSSPYILVLARKPKAA